MSRKIELPKIGERDIEKIYRYLSIKYYSLRQTRNQTVIALLLKTGLKTEPLIALNTNDYDKKLGILKPSHPKAPKKIVLDQTTQKLINRYLFLRKRKKFTKNVPALFLNTKPIFKNPEKLRLSARQIQRIVKEFAEKYELSAKLNPKSFRHLAGLYYTSLGIDHVTIDSILGNVAPWVKTDYIRLSKSTIVTNSSTPKLKELVCKHHNVPLEEAEHRKYHAIWLCPQPGCLYMLDNLGRLIIKP